MALLAFPGRTNRAVKLLAALLIVVQLVQLILVLKITNKIIVTALLVNPAMSHRGGAAPHVTWFPIMKQRHLQTIE